jgi:hypothetical protein
MAAQSFYYFFSFFLSQSSANHTVGVFGSPGCCKTNDDRINPKKIQYQEDDNKLSNHTLCVCVCVCVHYYGAFFPLFVG